MDGKTDNSWWVSLIRKVKGKMPQVSLYDGKPPNQQWAGRGGTKKVNPEGMGHKTLPPR